MQDILYSGFRFQGFSEEVEKNWQFVHVLEITPSVIGGIGF